MQWHIILPWLWIASGSEINQTFDNMPLRVEHWYKHMHKYKHTLHLYCTSLVFPLIHERKIIVFYLEEMVCVSLMMHVYTNKAEGEPQYRAIIIQRGWSRLVLNRTRMELLYTVWPTVYHNYNNTHAQLEFLLNLVSQTFKIVACTRSSLSPRKQLTVLKINDLYCAYIMYHRTSTRMRSTTTDDIEERNCILLIIVTSQYTGKIICAYHCFRARE